MFNFFMPGPMEIIIILGVLTVPAVAAVVAIVLAKKANRNVQNTANLVPCPDCGCLVSRLAKSCPQCGRPLTPEPPS